MSKSKAIVDESTAHHRGGFGLVLPDSSPGIRSELLVHTSLPHLLHEVVWDMVSDGRSKYVLSNIEIVTISSSNITRTKHRDTINEMCLCAFSQHIVTYG